MIDSRKPEHVSERFQQIPDHTVAFLASCFYNMQKNKQKQLRFGADMKGKQFPFIVTFRKLLNLASE